MAAPISSPSVRVAFQLARPLRRQDPAAFIHRCRTTLTTGRHAHSNLQLQRMSGQVHQHARAFSSTPLARATVVRMNPRVDDDGHEMTIEISERASKRLKKITTTPAQKNTLAPSSTSPDSHLRVIVTSGGCHGFQYLMSLEGAEKIDKEEDTIFASSLDSDAGKAEVVMDQASLELLKGSTVDFTTELIGSQFKIVGNPRAKSSCGCGTSFDID